MFRVPSVHYSILKALFGFSGRLSSANSRGATRFKVAQVVVGAFLSLLRANQQVCPLVGVKQQLD